jgi:hypothetical protein
MKRIISLITLSILSSAAFADDYFYMGIGDTGLDFESQGFNSKSIFGNPSFSIGGGHYFSEHFGVEGFFRYEESLASDESQELNFFNFGLSLIVTTQELGDTPFELFARATAMSTYAKQYATFDGTKDSIAEDTGGLFNISGGAIWNIGDNYWLRGEYIYGFASYGMGDFEADYDGFQLSLGLDF